MTPQRADLVLASDVPHGETQILVLHGLHVETNRRDGRDHFAKLQLVEDRGLSSCIKANHQDPHLGLANQSLPYLGESQTHGSERQPSEECDSIGHEPPSAKMATDTNTDVDVGVDLNVAVVVTLSLQPRLCFMSYDQVRVLWMLLLI